MASAPGEVIEQLQGLAQRGIQVAHGGVKDVWKIEPLEIIGREVLPAVAGL